jgi:hypothetical protein
VGSQAEERVAEADTDRLTILEGSRETVVYDTVSLNLTSIGYTMNRGNGQPET